MLHTVPTDRFDAAPGGDAALVFAAHAEPKAFAAIYDKYIDSVYRYCDRRLRNREAAEDATSQIFEKAFVSLPRFREGSLQAWLFTIAHNVVIDQYRRNHVDQPLEVAQLVPDSATTPEEAAITGDTAQTVRRLVELLTPEQREVIELRLAGLNGNEIMQVLQINRDVLGSRTFRAMAKMRDALMSSGAEGGGR